MIDLELKCVKCGNIVETIPTHCGYDMSYDENSNQLQCYMGPVCGYINLDEFICENCCK